MTRSEIRQRDRAAHGFVPVLLLVFGFALTVACSAFQRDDLRSLIEREDELFADGVRTAIAEPERADRAVELLRAFRARELAYRSDVEQLRSRLFALNAAYDASRSDFEVLRGELDGKRRELAGQLVETFSALKELMTPDEWTAVFERVTELNEEWEGLAS